jgi:hypothetical protein
MERRVRGFALVLIMVLAGCQAAPSGPPKPNAAGLMPLPCDGRGPLRPRNPLYCLLGRAYVTPPARAALVEAAQALVKAHPGSVVLFMDASGADGKRPFAPHLSHGDGREVDVAVFYRRPDGWPLDAPPTFSGYGAQEPPRPGDPLPCKGIKRVNDHGDAPASRPWRLDEARTRNLIEILIQDPRVKRIFIEPHLKRRFGLEKETKIRFAGCWAARHDDHLHVDFL